MTVTNETRRRVERMIEEVSRGFIDDSEIAFPDDADLASLKKRARAAAERRHKDSLRPGTPRVIEHIDPDHEAHSAG